MNLHAVRSRLLEAQRLLLDAQAELSEYHGEPTQGAIDVCDDRMREAMREIALARNEIRASEPPAPQPSQETF